MWWIWNWFLASALLLGATACCGLCPTLSKEGRRLQQAKRYDHWDSQFPNTVEGNGSLHPAVKIMGYYGVSADMDRFWVRPYIVNLYCFELLEYPAMRPVVRDYLEWYMARLNDRDLYGISGTLYDLFVTRDGGEEWTGEYDSADSYGATLLSLIRRYVDVTGDRSLADEHRKQMETIGDMILGLQDLDGLTYVWPGHDSKYLMDNCEVYMGLRDFAALRQSLWDIRDGRFAQAAARVRGGILRQLFEPVSLMFYYGLDRDGTRYESSWSKMYPDSIGQYYPIAYEVIDPGTPLARWLWGQFDARWKPGGLDSEDQRLVARMARKRMIHALDSDTTGAP